MAVGGGDGVRGRLGVRMGPSWGWMRLQAPWTRQGGAGGRTLTADQPPAQLPDVLLTGFFPLKFTPKSIIILGGPLASVWGTPTNTRNPDCLERT